MSLKLAHCTNKRHRDFGELFVKLVKLSRYQNNINQWFTLLRKPPKVFQVVFVSISKSLWVVIQSGKRLRKGKPTSVRIHDFAAQSSAEQMPTLSAMGNAVSR